MLSDELSPVELDEELSVGMLLCLKKKRIYMSERRKETIEEIWIQGNKNRKIIKPAIMLVEINIISHILLSQVGANVALIFLAAKEIRKNPQ